MSIAVLNQVYDEARRLAVAGSVVAKGDFRLKKLIPPLEQAGAKAPVFAKVAEVAKAVVEGPEEASAHNLLELTSLVTAVLYTQGETGAAGKLEPIETVDMGGTTSQTSARFLKPLLEALNNTGSGRVDLIKEAHERGTFRDLRLVKPALKGLDDPYPEVADYLAEKILPVYGKAVVPELKAKYDPKGGKSDARRLETMNRIDPTGTRELVTAALEGGSKEVKVAAIGCLGAKEDLPFLVEQAGAKTKDVREAAYKSLARLDDPKTVAVFAKALGGKDLELAVDAIRESKGDVLPNLLAAEIRTGWEALLKLKDKKKVSEAADRLTDLFNALPARELPAADDLVLEMFGRRDELTKIKGTNYSGSDVAVAVVERMANGPRRLREVLARAHAELEPENLADAVRAGRRVLDPAEVYDLFSPYLLAKFDPKKKGKNPSRERYEAVLDGIDADYIPYGWDDEDQDDDPFDDDDDVFDIDRQKDPPLDPRWLDIGLATDLLPFVAAAGRPGDARVDAFLTKAFEAEMKKKDARDIDDVVRVMVRLGHPGATDALLEAYEKHVLKKKGYVYDYWYADAIPRLPASALPKLEAFVPKLKAQSADSWVEAIAELRKKAGPA